MATRNLSVHAQNEEGRDGHARAESGDVPIQIMVPPSVRRQVALMSAERGESIRTVVLRGLQAVGIKIPDSELGDRRGRRRNGREGGNAAK
jgi:hypothetical protein